MPLTTANERASALYVALPWRGLYPFPDAAIGANDRAQIANMVGIRFTPVIASTTRIQLPIDYALAGDQDERFNRGAMRGRALRKIFGE